MFQRDRDNTRNMFASRASERHCWAMTSHPSRSVQRTLPHSAFGSPPEWSTRKFHSDETRSNFFFPGTESTQDHWRRHPRNWGHPLRFRAESILGYDIMCNGTISSSAWKFVGVTVRALLRLVAGCAHFWSFYSSAGCAWVAELSPLSTSVSSASWNSEHSKVEVKHLEDKIIFKCCMFLRVGSGTNESTMSRFSTPIKGLHILNNFSKLLVVDFEDASTSFCGLKSLFGSCLFTHDGASTANKELDGFNNSLWHQQDSQIEAWLAMASAHAVRLSPSVQNRNCNSTYAK